jgi:hypothetical protein
MTKRAILWCGHIRAAIRVRDAEGRLRERGDPLLAADDFRIQVNGLELAFRTARALGVPREEIHACVVRDDLRPRELVTERHQPTVAGLRRLAGSLARGATAADALLFVAANHGRRDGSLVTDDPLDEVGDPIGARLDAETLGDCLRPIAGAQVLVIATCFAGAFLPLAADPRRAVVAACSATEEHRVSRDDGTCSAFLDELFGAWSGVAHSDAVPCTRLPLDAAFARAKERLLVPPSLNVPEYAGTNVWPR